MLSARPEDANYDFLSDSAILGVPYWTQSLETSTPGARSQYLTTAEGDTIRHCPHLRSTQNVLTKSDLFIRNQAACPFVTARRRPTTYNERGIIPTTASDRI